MPPSRDGLLPLPAYDLMLEGLLPWDKMSLKKSRAVRAAGGHTIITSSCVGRANCSRHVVSTAGSSTRRIRLRLGSPPCNGSVRQGLPVRSSGRDHIRLCPKPIWSSLLLARSTRLRAALDMGILQLLHVPRSKRLSSRR
jgi:hypothetical protein